MSEAEQAEDIQPEITIKPEVKPKNPKRVEAGKKGAEARRLKKMQVMEVKKPESTTPEENPIKINIYKTYLPACVVVIGIAALYMYRNKPVQQVNEAAETDTKQYDPFEF